jgi:regulator of nonsense transcripts 3
MLIVGKNPTGNEATKPPKTKAHNEGEKLVLRRLPPGMTQTECMAILGTEWELGKGRVDWVSWKPGKTSTEWVAWISLLDI